MIKNIFFKNRISPVYLLAVFIILLSFLTRFALLVSFSKDMNAGFGPVLASFFVGILFDIITTAFIIIPITLLVTFRNDFVYTKKGKWFAIAFFALILFILLFTSIIPSDFNKDIYKALIGYVFLRVAIYVILFFAGDTWRKKWRLFMLDFLLAITIFCLLFNAISEWFFWDEFFSRYNFIAVDYLVYTNEVLGNIKESYPVGWLVGGVAVITTILMFAIHKPLVYSLAAPLKFIRRVGVAAVIFLIALAGVYFVNPQWKNFSSNNYTNELAGNGLYEFVQAFKKNELDFYKYYKTIPDAEAFRLVRTQLSSPNATFTGTDSFSIDRDIRYELPENKMNVVLISVESLSASFLKEFGNKDDLTPNLDTLAQKGMLFTNLYSSGTRTVRGLEALALSIPPTPGQSLVKRPGNEGMFSLGHVFKSKGYNAQYIYGGYGYFDNMNYFFGHNSYEVVDRSSLSPAEIHYANIWGVADEDLFTLALKNLDSNHAAGKPFFTHIMTVSNHKPYTYPENRIDIPPSSHSRSGAVKYTDYAIGDFIKRAASKSWFRNTMFVIVADHCASSAGSTALPVTGYHIPMIIYAPGSVAPQKIDVLTAQIDIGPTILGMLHMNYHSKFFGQDIFNTPADKHRAFISTYQGLGFIQNGELILQSPVKQIRSYIPDFTTGVNAPAQPDSAKINDAISFYQTAAWLIRHKKYNAQ
jgi:phosphoglycerol transferase MdoB-like AlkP superfamily enzyme